MRLGMCKTSSILDYRAVMFLEGGYVRVTAANDKSLVAKVTKGPCLGVSREVAFLLYPHYGWGKIPVEAESAMEAVELVKATRVVTRVPFGIGEAVVRRQLEGFPVCEGSMALEYLEHVEFGEVVHVEPARFSVLAPDTTLRLVELPVEDSEVVFMRR